MIAMDESKNKIAALRQQLRVYKHLCDQQFLLIQELKDLCEKYKKILDSKEHMLDMKNKF